MTRRAVDTNVLIYAHLASFPEHARAKHYLQTLLSDPESALVVTPIILHELVHVVTDGRRFDEPVKIEEAIALARLYLNRTNVECLDVGASSLERALALMERYALGRKRIADTLLVATLLDHGVNELVTCNESDFAVFEELTVVNPISTS